MKPFNIDERTLPPLFDLGAVWNILWQRRRMVLASIGTVLLLALLYLAVTKPSYTATASILIDPRDSRATNFDSVLPGIGMDSAAIASQVFVIQSRDLLMKVLESEGIESDPEFADRGLLSFLWASGALEKDSIFKRFQRRVSVERAGLTYVINVSFMSEVSDKAARIANAIVDRYRAGLSGERETANSDVSALLADKISGLQKNVSDAERTVGDFKIKHQILDVAAGGTLQSQIDQVTDQLIAARGDADRAKDKYDQALVAGTLPADLGELSEILSSSTIEKLRDDYNKRAAELANSETVYQPRHPLIRRLKSELNKTEGLMAAEAKRITRELNAKYDLALQNVTTLQAKLDALRQQSESSDAAQVQLRRLESTAQAARSVLDDFLKRAEETSQLQGLQLPEARVISMAAPPAQPTWPKPFLLLPVSAALGLIAGCGLALVNGPIRQPQDGSPTPPRGLLQAIDTQKDDGAALSRPEPVPINFGEYRLPARVGFGAQSSIRAIRRRFFQAGSEAFSRDLLQLVRRIILHLTEHPKPYVLLVSSIHNPFEAKLAGAMIGIGFQQADQKVLVVEFDGSARHGTGVFVNGASGLQTVVYNTAASRAGGTGRRFTADDILADAGAFDFVLMMGPAVIDNSWDPELFADADLMLFALGPSEEESEATSLLRKHLDSDQIRRSATLVIAPEGIGSAENRVARPIRSAGDGEGSRNVFERRGR
ncbi:exopolysaccharide biosynthesis protein [Pararhizobium polonicum]|uniref:Exopolysaccharide biosynthesis protein n=1 Tax=Pararhizobium polonicum TaxID=1612624 RepID=A0A1C7P7Y2_9HYPH|nr:GumC family protein [Pararhizobium polonicum]OBZ95834.1 exopolysaccharide biosynthesis protein [Pararhizobium polonicum]